MAKYKIKVEDSNRNPYQKFNYDMKQQTIGGIEQVKYFDVSLDFIVLLFF
jgi:hypothetical protein